jgi:hypothetical protein
MIHNHDVSLLSMPACQSALQPWVSLGLLYNQSPPSVRFLNKIIFYRMALLAPCPVLLSIPVSLCSDISFYVCAKHILDVIVIYEKNFFNFEFLNNFVIFRIIVNITNFSLFNFAFNIFFVCVNSLLS